MIVVGGEALVDLVISPKGEVTAKLGGGPFNAARTIGRLGVQVAYLGALSNDRFGSMLHAQLVADGVDDSLVRFTELPTTLAAAELDESGAASYRFYLTDTSAPLGGVDRLPADARILHVGTLGMVLEPMATSIERLVAGTSTDVLVLLDPNCRPRVTPDRDAYLARLERMAARADVVKVSTDDLEFIAPGANRRCIDSFVANGSVVLHTDGAHGVHVYFADGGAAHVAAPTVEVVDTIGAGDSFGGAFVAWWREAGLGRADLVRHEAVLSAVGAAVQVAARNCSRAGAEPPTRHELGAAWMPVG